MKQLQQTLTRIDGKGYKAYKDTLGTYQASNFILHIDHIQADPYASPSRMRIEVSNDELGLQKEWVSTPARRTALTDFLARSIYQSLRNENLQKGIMIDRPGQEILERTAVVVDAHKTEVRLSLHLPARGRTILGRQAANRLTKDLPRAIEQGLLKHSAEKREQQLQLADQQEALRQFVHDRGAIGFVANGSVLPRESGISDRPLSHADVTTFTAPTELEETVDLPHGKTVTGMLIQAGVTIIVGGGYHGKSTLLEALERSVYDHIAGDGREFVVSAESAAKVRAEDGRSVTGVNISPFISNLPNNKDTQAFTSENASGSTSQAANIVEQLEVGSSVLLIDEDTSATNFMIRDARMQALVAKNKEPITPFIDKVRALYDEHGVSTVLVVGGAGDYFDVADHVIMMDAYQPYYVTEEAKRIANSFGEERQKEAGATFGSLPSRNITPDSFNATKGKKEKVDSKGKHKIIYGTTDIDLSFIEQLTDPSQTRAIAEAIRYLAKHYFDGSLTLNQVLDAYEADVEKKGLEVISPFKGKHPGDLALPRRYEVAAAINRMRTLNMKQS
ncbi:ABC-ATPase domain-containing protein [Salsuginibacillus kocurii]|uniref:ABC-ATPase domain-containing protein n=1 Tax=Salsuginibacillus kocurii TaxID=427078 RepID=UPI000373485D|nr:ABC-ATPase domain-containing protein [Salsuginibacillus kocurii]